MSTQEFKNIIDSMTANMQIAFNKGNYKQIVLILRDITNAFHINNITEIDYMSDAYLLKLIQGIEKCVENSEQLDYLYSNIYILFLPYLSDDDKKIDRLKRITSDDLKTDSYMQASFKKFMGECIKSLSDDKKKVEQLAIYNNQIINISEVIASVHDDNIKIALIDKYNEVQDDSYGLSSIISSFMDDDLKISFLNKFKDKINDKSKIIISIKDEEKRIEILQEFHLIMKQNIFKFNEEEKKEYIFDDKLIIAVIQTLSMYGIKKIAKDYKDIIINQYRSNPDTILIPYLIIIGVNDKIINSIKELCNEENSIIITHYVEKLLIEDKLTMDNINIISKIKYLLSDSQFSDSKKSRVMNFLLQSKDPIEQFVKINYILRDNNVPNFIKQYLISRVLFEKDDYKPDFSLKKGKSDDELWQTIFMDLMQITLGSCNNDNIYFLKDLVTANELFNKVKNSEIKFEDLSNEKQSILKQYLSKLSGILNFINFNNIEKKYLVFDDKTDINVHINTLLDLYAKNTSRDYDILDRAVEIIMSDIGISSFNDLIKFIAELKHESEQRHISNSKVLVLEKGDYIQGAGDVRYLSQILDNGILAGELLNINAAAHDNTPFGADFAIIKGNTNNLKTEIEQTPSNGFGPIYFIIKKQTAEKFLSVNGGKAKYTMELYPDPGHDYPEGDAYIMRTGCPSSVIDYIITENSEDIIAMKEILVTHRIYIPVVDYYGNIVFSYEEYQGMIKKSIEILADGITIGQTDTLAKKK